MAVKRLNKDEDSKAGRQQIHANVMRQRRQHAPEETKRKNV